MSHISCALEIVEIRLQMVFATQTQGILVALTNFKHSEQKRGDRNLRAELRTNPSCAAQLAAPVPVCPSRIHFCFPCNGLDRSFWGFSLFVWFAFFPRSGAP